MKVQYIGQSFGVDSLTSGKVYECLEILKDFAMLRVIDDSGEDYCYSATDPGSLNEPISGKWKIIEDDENGSLAKVIPPLT